MIKKYFSLKNLIILFALSSVLLWIFVIPFDRAPDEIAHWTVSYYIAETGHLPAFGDSYDLLCPAHIGASCRMKMVPETGCYVSGNEIFFNPAYLAGAFFIALFKFFGAGIETLQIVARFASFLFFAWVLYFALKVSKLWLRSEKGRLFFLGFIALLPQMIFLGTYFNPDIFSLAAIFGMIYYATKIYSEERPSGKNFAYLGIFAGLTLLSKYNFFLAFLFPALFLGAKIWKSVLRQKGLSGATNYFLSAAIALIIGGWLFARNYILYGTFLGMNYLDSEAARVCGAAGNYGAIQQGLAKNMIDMFRHTNWLSEMTTSFFGRFDGMFLPYSPDQYTFVKIFLAALALFSFGSAIVFARKFFATRSKTGDDKKKLYLIAFSIAIFAASIYISARNSLYFDYQAQGRYLFNVLPFIAFLFAFSNEKIRHNLAKEFVFKLVLFVLVIFNFIACYGLFLKNYY